MPDRKPKPPQSRPPAEILLNQFLKEKKLALGIGKPNISFTNDGQIIIGRPAILVVYQDQTADNQILKNPSNTIKN